MTDHERLTELFRERALRFGDFTLASGKKASYYLDGKQITLHAEGLRLVAEGMLQKLASLTSKPVHAVGGMVIGADPIIGGILAAAAETEGQKNLVGVLVRKEAKGHGTQKFVEGPLQAGQNVVVVEDVVTTGGSSLLAIERIEAFGAKVVGVISIIDRMEGGRAAFESAGYAFDSLLTIEDFGITPPSS